MKVLKSHKKRVEKVKDFTGKNKVFVMAIICAIIFLVCNFASKQSEKLPAEIHQTNIVEENPNESEIAVESENNQWRFYFIDLVILAAGSGFCLIMILRERKNVKEKL